MMASSENKCKNHPKLENDSYCVNCKSLLCVMCALSHKKAHSDHDIDSMPNIMMKITSEIDQLDPTIVSADLVQAEMIGEEEQLKIKLFELTKVTENVKAMVVKCIDNWAKSQIDKIVKDLDECASIKSQMKLATEFSQKREKMLELIPELYAEKKFDEIIRMKESVREIKESLEKSKGAKEKVKIIQEKNKKLRNTFNKESMERLSMELTKILNQFMLFSYADVCSKCNFELKQVTEINKCENCLKSEIIFCKNCILKCKNCGKNCCQKCVKLCAKCNKNRICVKCKDEICKECDIMENTLLNKENRLKLEAMYGKEIKVKSLLFKASRDGFNRQAFHLGCDAKGPTITIVKSQYDQIFGGYAEISWDSKGDKVKCNKNFVFSLSMNKMCWPLEDASQYNHSDYGPWFGTCYFGIGYSQDNWNTDSNSCLDGSISNSHFETLSSYISGTSIGYFSVKEVEVFSVEI